MELVKKVCRFCYKGFNTPRKQQRYCSVTCSYRGKNKKAFNSYIADRTKVSEQSNADSIKVQRWRPDNDMAGLCLDRESYSE